MEPKFVRRVSGAAACALASVALTLPTQAFAGQLPAPISDCAADGRIDGHYSKRTLQRAIRELPADVAAYTPCEHRLRRALAHGGDGRLRGSGSRSIIYRDCGADGRLDRRHPLSALRRALLKLPADLAEHTACRSVLRSELEARR